MANEQDELSNLCRQAIEEIEAKIKPLQRAVAVLRIAPAVRLEPAEVRALKALVELLSGGSAEDRTAAIATDNSLRELLAKFKSRMK